MLYPLFVKDIKKFLYHPANYARTTAVLAAANSRQAQQPQPGGPLTELRPEERGMLERSNNMPTPLDRSLSMLTPPSSASTNSDYRIEHSSLGPISETHARAHSLPGTPATTPPAPGYFSNNNGGQQVYMNSFHEFRGPVSGNHYGQHPDMQRSYNHSRNTSMMSYTEEDLNKDTLSRTQLLDGSRPLNHIQRNNGAAIEPSIYHQTSNYANTRNGIGNTAVGKVSGDVRLTPTSTTHQRSHSRAHSRGSNKVFSTPNLTTQMGRRASMTPAASPAFSLGHHSNNQSGRESMPSEATLWVQQQQQMVFSTPQQSSRGHARQMSGQLPHIYEETPSCRMAYQLHGQGRLSEPYPRLVEGAQAFKTPAGSPVRGQSSTEVAPSPLIGKKKRDRVVSDSDQYHHPHSAYDERQESLTPPPICKQQSIEESPKRRRSERTGMHSRSGSVF